MAVVPLPQSVQVKLRELAAGIRRMRVLRGVCWLALTLLLAPILALGLDSLFDLSPRIRSFILGAWLLGGIAAAWWFVLRRIFGRVPAAVLARAVEANYPSLAERLQTLVELSETGDASNGSRAMVLMLARDTERRTARLNFLSAAPRGFTLRLAGISSAVILLALSPLLFLSDTGDRVRRLVQPWHAPIVEQPYRVVVSSGNPVLKRGEAVTLAGYAERIKPTDALPESAVVIVREKGSAEKTFPMRGDGKAAFTFTKPSVNADFEYSIGLGTIRSEWYAVSAVDPVAVASGTTMRILPPEYAKAIVVPTERPGLGEIEVLQFGSAAFDLKFDRAVQSATLEWRPHGEASDKPAERVAVQFTADRLSAKANFPIRTDGVLKWVFTGEKDVRSEVPLAVRTLRDMPPQFEKIAGFPSMAREIRPDESLVFDVAVRDDISVSTVLLEYGRLETIGSQPPFSEPLPLAGIKTARAEGRIAFSLAGKFREGEQVVFRLRVVDNRSVPEANLSPQEVTFPEKGWATLRVTSTAKSLMEQEIAGQQQSVHVTIAAIRAALAETSADLATLRPEILGRPKLAADQSVRLTNDRERAQQCALALETLAREADKVPDLRGIAGVSKEIAEKHLRKAEDQLRKTIADVKAESRDAGVQLAQADLDRAVAKLDELLKLNALTGELRRDSGKLAQLAEEQKRLADAGAKEPNPAAKQRDLRDRLRDVLKSSDPLSAADRGNDENETRELADELDGLRKALSKLDATAQDLEQTSGKKQLERVAEKQKELTEQIAELANRTEAAARLSNTAKLAKEPSQNARDAIERQQPVQALTEQEKSARDLDRLAEALGKAAVDGRDARLAAAQLERWQRDLRNRLAEAEKEHPAGIPDELRKKLRTEQEALGKAIGRLSLPPSEQLEQLRRESSERSANAAKELQNDPASAGAALEKSADTLGQLGKRTPGNAERNKSALGELEKLRREQDTITREAEEALRNNKDLDELAKMLKPVAEKQDELSKKLTKLDAPDHQDRRERAADLGNKATGDLAKGEAREIPASQRDAKKQLDRFKEELEGKVSSDRAAGELARLQNELSEDLQRKAALAPDELQRLQRDQRDIQRQLGQLAAPEAAGPLADAKKAVQESEAATAKPMPDVDELKKKNKAAAEALDRLAEHLGGTSKRPSGPPPPIDPTNALPAQADADLARELAGKQRELREELSRTVAGAPKPEADEGRAKLESDHGALAEAAKKTAGRLEERAPKNERFKKAADAVKEAGERLAEAAQNSAKRKTAAAAAQRAKASEALQRASESVGRPKGSSGSPKTAESIAETVRHSRDAEKAMEEAIQKIETGKPSTSEMTKAAEQLKKASEKLSPGKADGPGDTAGSAEPKDGSDPSGRAPSDVKPGSIDANLGKSWGDLPGEVKAQMTQELKAKYGEDYARIIKLYFEQLAERK